MTVRINCTLDVHKGQVRLRHEVPTAKNEEDRLGIFGVPAFVKPEEAASICKQLAPWIKERFRVEAEAALAD